MTTGRANTDTASVPVAGASTQQPLVGYLKMLPGGPVLEGRRCQECEATFLDRRSHCAGCSSEDLASVRLPTTGHVRGFTVVHRTLRGADPYTSVVVELVDGTYVKANLDGDWREREADLAGLRVELDVFVAATDSTGVRAVAPHFVPAASATPQAGL